MKIEVDNIEVNEVQDYSTLYSRSFHRFNNVLFEDFNDNRNNWDLDEDDDTSREIKGGNYVIEHKREEKGWLYYKSSPFDPLRDFEIETSLSQISGVDNYGYGLVWGTMNGKNSYSFVITSNGYYKIYKYEMDYDTEESEYLELLEWTNAGEIINPLGTQNKISIRKEGELLKFFINENFVHELDFMHFLGPKIGWDLSRNMVVEVDNIIIRQNAGNLFDQLPQIYAEEFTNNSRGWPEGDEEESSSFVRDGKFIIEHKKEDGSWHWWDNGIPLDDKKNFEIEIGARHLSGIENYGFGFTYGMKDTDNYYGFNISANGYYQIFEYRDDNYLDLREWTYVPGIINPAGTGQNILKIRKEGDLVHYFINGKYITHTPFKGIFGDRVGFRLYKNMKVEMDYIRVRQSSQITSTLATTTKSNINNNQNNFNVTKPPGFREIDSSNICW